MKEVLYDPPIVVKTKIKPIRCRWRKLSIKKIYEK